MMMPSKQTTTTNRQKRRVGGDDSVPRPNGKKQHATIPAPPSGWLQLCELPDDMLELIHRLAGTPRALANTCTRLRRLLPQHWWLHNGVCGAHIEERAARLPPVRLLHVELHGGLGEDRTAVAPVARAMPQLRRLEYIATRWGGCKDDTVAIAQHCPQLQELRMTGEYLGSLLKPIVRGCKQLVHIDIHDWAHVTNHVATIIGTHCPQLLYLDIGCSSNVTDVGMQAIARGCTLLQHITVEFCGRVTDTGIDAIARGCTALQAIDISGTAATVVGVEAIAQHCVQLRSITLVCRQGTDAALLVVARHRSSSLRELIPGPAATVDGVADVLCQCTQLQRLALWCNKPGAFNDVGVCRLAPYCSRLQELDVSQCLDITDRGLAAIARHCAPACRIVARGLPGKGPEQRVLTAAMRATLCEQFP